MNARSQVTEDICSLNISDWLLQYSSTEMTSTPYTWVNGFEWCLVLILDQIRGFRQKKKEI